MIRPRHFSALIALALLAAAAQLHSQSAEPAPLPTLPVKVLMQSPADTTTDLQIICLFASTPENTLHGSLVETNDKLHGLLDRIRKPNLFAGELGETILLTPPPGSLGAKHLLIIGLGDSATFTPARMEFVGKNRAARDQPHQRCPSVLRAHHPRRRRNQVRHRRSGRAGDPRLSRSTRHTRHR